MRIQHNIMAMNAYRNYNTNTSALSKNLEKLSSGYKINRAGDDAAGLAISEKMRAQITGLNAAQKNVKDGISLVKTAEGAMQEIQDMLNRMDYLATQSANGTYDDPVDRYNLQKEVNQLRSEINRIADSANFNGIKLLNGDMSLAKPESMSVSVAVNTVGTATLGVSASGGTLSGAAGQLDSKFVPSATANDGLHPGSPVVTATDAKFTIDISGITVTGVSTSTGDSTVVTITIGGLTVSAAVSHATATSINGTDVAAAFNNATVAIDGVEYKMTANAGKITFQATTAGTADGHATTINAILQNEVEVGVTGGTGNKAAVGGSWVHGVQDITKGVDTAPGALAGVSFKLDGDIVANGNQLTIGTKTYTFKVGSGSTVTGTNLIDLSKYEADDPELFNAAAIALAKSTTTDINNAQTVGGTSITTNFKISSVDGNTIHIDQVKQTSGDDVTYTKDMLKSLFTVKQVETAPVNATITLSATPGAADGLNEGDLVSYKTTDAEGKEVVKSFTIGTAPTDAKNPESYISAASFNALLQSDASKSLKAAADLVLNGEGSTYAGQFSVTMSGSNVVITANDASGADGQTKLDAIKAAIQAKASVSFSKISKDDAANGLSLQIGDTSDSFNQLRVNVGDMHVDAMGTMETIVEGGRATAVAGKSIDDIDISTQAGAQAAVDVIKNAINYVSGIRGDLGATQNRLEHTANNLSVMAENIQDAESTIRDTDIAEEMMAYTKNNILVQSAQAMLAQANAVPQGVLQLLG